MSGNVPGSKAPALPGAQYRDGTIVVEGRVQQVVETMMAVSFRYEKTATILAIEAASEGLIYTPEGAMGFRKGDMICSDDPPTHAWPVRREVFERTYRLIGPRPSMMGAPDEG